MARKKSLLRFRLRTLLVAVAFAAVLLAWLSDRRRLEEKIQQRDDLLSVLRAAATSDSDSHSYGAVVSTACNSGEELVAWVRDSHAQTRPYDEVSFFGPSDDVVPIVLPLLKDPSTTDFDVAELSLPGDMTSARLQDRRVS